MLFEELKKAKMQAMKNKDLETRKALEAVISKCMLLSVEKKAQGSELTDSDTLSIIQKTIKELNEELLSFKEAGRLDNVKDLELQVKAISSYLPKQLSEEEIKEIIGTLPDKSIPFVMKHFKTNYQGQVDMKLVSKLAKEA